MNTEQEPKFCAVTYDAQQQPIDYWLGTKLACERFLTRSRQQDERVKHTRSFHVEQETTWEQMRDELFPRDPNAKGRVIWSGTWAELEVK